MKTNPFVWFLILLTAGLAAFCFVRIGQLNSEIVSLKKNLADKTGSTAEEPKKTPVIEQDEESDEETEDIEIVHYMQRIQNFHAKLHAAGKNKNKELIKFYLHELEEEMEIIAESNISEEGVNISENMKNFGLNQVKTFETALETSTFNFDKSFEALTTSCNGCHSSTKHEYIRIITPTGLPVVNQNFKP